MERRMDPEKGCNAVMIVVTVISKVFYMECR